MTTRKIYSSSASQRGHYTNAWCFVIGAECTIWEFPRIPSDFYYLDTMTNTDVAWHVMTTLTSCSADCVVWVNASNGELPSQAWVAWASSDSYPSPPYVGRAAHNGGLFPATLLPHKGVAHVPWGGQNYEKDNYQVKDNYISWGKLFPFIFLCHLAF